MKIFSKNKVLCHTAGWLGIVLLFFCSKEGMATPVLQVDTSFETAALGAHIELMEDAANTLDIEQVLEEQYIFDFQNHSQTNLTIGQAYAVFWGRIQIENTTAEKIDLVAEIGNSEVDKIDVFITRNGIVTQQYALGEAIPVADRAIQYHFFAHPVSLEGNDILTIYYRIDLTLEPLNARFELTEQKHFYEKKQSNYYFHGLYSGLLFFVAFLSIILAFSTRRHLFSYYALYSLSIGFLTLGYTNIGYQFFWKNGFWMAHFSRLVFGMCTALTLMLFTFEYFKKYTITQKLKPVQRIVVGLMLLQIVLFPFLFNNILFPGVWSYIYYLPIYSITFCTLGCEILVFVLLVKDFKWEYLAFFLAYTLINISAVIRYMVSEELLSVSFFTENIVPFASMIEQMFLSVLLLIFVRKTYTEQLTLSKSLAAAKEENFRRFLLGQRQERQRLSQALHDGASLHLANIQMHLSTLQPKVQKPTFRNQLEAIVQQLGIVSNDIRNFSHDLSPVVLEQYGLIFALEDLIEKLESSHEDIHFEFEYATIPRTAIGDYIEQSLYFIAQELLHNAIKHSDATHIRMKLQKEEQVVCLTVTDNGKGYDVEKSAHQGIGLENIRTRVGLHDGVFKVESVPFQATRHVVCLPLN